MKIEFEINNFPKKISSPYDVYSYTEGTIQIKISGAIILSIEGTLLVEFATFLKSWLTRLENGFLDDMYYLSQDFEEEPLVLFKLEGRNCVLISSEFMEKEVKVTLVDLKNSSLCFLDSLALKLKEIAKIDISKDLVDASKEPWRHIKAQTF